MQLRKGICPSSGATMHPKTKISQVIPFLCRDEKGVWCVCMFVAQSRATLCDPVDFFTI